MSPERMCVGCRGRAEQHDLLRLVVDPAHVVVCDDERRRPGRGAYVHADASCIARARQRRAVPRALRDPDCDVGVLSGLQATYANSGDTR